ncbi:NAD-dependent epimerase/dehydratase family protein [Bacteroidetes bacterium endosymbiont of Geopemphigus sp.]|uniref:NAD-dependent epimerase/dehydratase family protein n=1 Tax=Bacteroidetes bacterium endosymbiont of Geopemphigus sp. TaxID=2047937 RepID=UPI000CD05D70|nr:NAD-dependent epimerase/dehydratase family protein [Bacteroidetes bacterium endosymbiont of Geopemphigus sp.]
MKKILVTGATGLLGSHLLLYLLQGTQEVRALKRKGSIFENIQCLLRYYEPENSEALFKKIEWAEADLLDIPALDEALKGVCEVYHAAGMVDFNRKKKKALMRTNVEGTTALVNACLEEGVERFCHISSIATLGEGKKHEQITEKSDFQKRAKPSAYAQSKYLGEMEVYRAIQEGLKAVIVHPGIILASTFWESSSGALFREIQKRWYFYPTGSSAYIDARDLAKCCIALMRDEFMNQNYILIDENCSHKEIITKIRKDLNLSSPRGIIERNLRNFSKLNALWAFLSGRDHPLSSGMVESLTSCNYYSNEKIRKTLGYQFMGIDSALNEHLERYKKAFL